MLAQVRLFVLVFMLTTLVATFTPLATYSNDIKEHVVDIAKANHVIVSCGKSIGQGTIYNVDETGVWIITVRHLAKEGDCFTEFPNGEMHSAGVSALFKKSDVAMLFVNRAYWGHQARMRPMKLGALVFGFKNIRSWAFNYDYTMGYVLAKYPGFIYNGETFDSLYITDMYSEPGSSGAGVYDTQGNLVGLISMGNVMDPYITGIVNLIEALEHEQD